MSPMLEQFGWSETSGDGCGWWTRVSVGSSRSAEGHLKISWLAAREERENGRHVLDGHDSQVANVCAEDPLDALRLDRRSKRAPAPRQEVPRRRRGTTLDLLEQRRRLGRTLSRDQEFRSVEQEDRVQM